MSTFVLKREYALQMPTSYVDIDRDEMEYVDGGWSPSILANNLKGLYNKYAFARNALVGSGITLAVIRQIAAGSATYLYTQIAATLGTIAAANWVVGAVIGVTASAAFYAMGTWSIF